MSDDQSAFPKLEGQKFALPDLLAMMSDQEAACFVLKDLHYSRQLIAARSLVRRHRESDKAYEAEIASLEERANSSTGFRNDADVGELIDRYDESAHRDAVHSMAALGMLAPLTESVFHQAFLGIGLRQTYEPSHFQIHARSQCPNRTRWDCHYHWNGEKTHKDVVKGIEQLADAVDLTCRLPHDAFQVLQALFAYRNNMFHHGHEWPDRERKKFENKISQNGWPLTWFSPATIDETPWIFYLTDGFIDHCFTNIEKLIEGIGAHCKENMKYEPTKGGAI